MREKKEKKKPTIILQQTAAQGRLGTVKTVFVECLSAPLHCYLLYCPPDRGFDRPDDEGEPVGRNPTELHRQRYLKFRRNDCLLVFFLLLFNSLPVPKYKQQEVPTIYKYDNDDKDP